MTCFSEQVLRTDECGRNKDVFFCLQSGPGSPNPSQIQNVASWFEISLFSALEYQNLEAVSGFLGRLVRDAAGLVAKPKKNEKTLSKTMKRIEMAAVRVVNYATTRG